MRTVAAHQPSGVVTFLFTDIEGSTWLVQELGERYDGLLLEHHRLLREVWAANGGYEVSTEGDAFFVAFHDPGEAVGAAVEAQRRLGVHEWPSPVRVRIGIHTGDARIYDGDYVGLHVHRAARVASAAHGGQVLVSEATKRSVVGELSGVGWSDLGLHRLKDLAEPVRLYQITSSGLDATFPPPRSLTVMPNNFPLQVTTFVGREDDMDGVREGLESSRLVTLTGAGGVGKTRLALQVAAELLDSFPAGAWLVDLAPLGDPDLVAGAAAAALGVRAQAGRPILDSLTDHLLEADALLLLDNCEHVIDECARVVHHLLASCPGVRVLATSREGLNVSGETTWRMRSLGVPDDSDSLAELARTESVRLFVQRARAAQPRFELTEESGPAVAKICRRLDGLPLAIELAAARTRTMTQQDVADGLDDRFRLLTGGTRLALPRQRTLEATVSWSYDLLTEPERRLFERLSVFSGGWSVDAATEVCSDEAVPAGDVLALLTQLVDRSLLVAGSSETGMTRYRALETLRQFGRERLLERGEIEVFRARHLDWVVDRAQALPAQTGAALPPEVAEEEDNLRSAVEWAIDTGAAGAGLKIIATVWFGHFTERARWYEQLLPGAEDVSPEVRANAFFAGAGLCFMTGDWRLGEERYEAGARAASEAGLPLLESLGLTYLGACRWALGDREAALRSMEEGLAVARRSRELEGERRALMFQAWWHTESDIDRAEALAADLDSAAEIDGTPFQRAHIREVVGFVRSLKGDLAGGGEVLAEAVGLFTDVLRSCSAHVLEAAASWAAMSGELELGAELWGAAAGIREDTGDEPRPWERSVQERWLPRIREGLDPGDLERAWARGRARTYEETMRFAQEVLGARSD